MSDADLRRYHLARIGFPPFWTSFEPTDPEDVRHRIVECAREHMMKAEVSSYRVNADAGFVYRHGISHYPDRYVDLIPSPSR